MGQVSRRKEVARGSCDRCGAAFEKVARSQPYRYCSRACAVPPPIESFWAKVEKGEGCWHWQGKTNPCGYGELQRGNRWFSAHRYAFQISTGQVIPEGMEVCHRCDDRLCVRPDHLFLGTHSDNMRDMAAKGRGVYPLLRGSGHGASKLTEAQVAAIRSDARAQRAIAADYGISQPLVSMIRNGKVRAHATEQAARAAA